MGAGTVRARARAWSDKKKTQTNKTKQNKTKQQNKTESNKKKIKGPWVQGAGTVRVRVR